MTDIRRLCIYCASNDGAHADYRSAAADFGRLLADRGIGLIYGGGRTGLMGALADSALAAGGEVIGVMPHALVQREVAHRGLTELHIVDSMHERKALLASLADGFVALPGGLGTLEELSETWTWAGLGVHTKPIGLLDVRGFWQPLLAFITHAAREGFLRDSPTDWLLVDEHADSLLDRLRTFVPPHTRRWLRPDET